MKKTQNLSVTFVDFVLLRIEGYGSSKALQLSHICRVARQLTVRRKAGLPEKRASVSRKNKLPTAQFKKELATVRNPGEDYLSGS